MTEQEAKTKWCPFSRVPLATEGAGVRSGAPVVNRSTIEGAVEANSNCIGSACMAWRRDGDAEELCTTHHNEHVKPEGDAWVWRDNGIDDFGWFRPASNRSGFCGLAGKP